MTAYISKTKKKRKIGKKNMRSAHVSKLQLIKILFKQTNFSTIFQFHDFSVPDISKTQNVICIYLYFTIFQKCWHVIYILADHLYFYLFWQVIYIQSEKHTRQNHSLGYSTLDFNRNWFFLLLLFVLCLKSFQFML